MPHEITRLMTAVTALLERKASDMDLTPQMLASIRPHVTPSPAVLPVLSLLSGTRDRAGAETRDVVDALIAAADHLPWRQTYDEADGFDRRYLDTYGWTDLAADGGPYRADGFRVMLGYWGQGLVYPDHSHPPEEHYLVLAGSALFRLGDDPFVRLGAGQVFHVPTRAVHSAEMRDEGLLAISVWRGADVSVQINLTDTDRDVTMG